MVMHNHTSSLSILPISLLVCLCMVISSFSLSSGPFQDETKAQVRIDLGYFKMAKDSSYLTVKVQTRQERQYVPVTGVIVNLFLNEQTKSGMMGNITTDQDGKGIFILPDKFYQAKDTLTTFKFMARIKNDPNFQDKLTSLEIQDASIIISREDSLKRITARLTQKDRIGSQIPVEGASIKFYVRRMFSLLPVGEEYNFTNESGEATIDFPKDLPGDAAGNIQLVAGIEEDDNFGNVMVESNLPWGSDLLIHEDTFDERTMWSSRDKTPIYLLVVPNLMLLVVWGIIAYLIVQLVRIHKDSGSFED